MTLERAIEILENFQKFRNGEHVEVPYTRKQVTEALDVVIKHHKPVFKPYNGEDGHWQ